MRSKLPLVGAYVLAAAFVFFGVGKLAGQAEVVELFRGWGYPAWFVYLTGVLEVGGAALSAIPRTRPYGAALIVLVMIGAIGSHVTHADFGGMFPAAIVFLALAVYVAVATRPSSLPWAVEATTADGR